MCDKKIMKPVWRVNSGLGVPSDLGDTVLAKGMIFHESEEDVKEGINNAGNWRPFLSEKPFIAAYQTTRTKAAKYERVECDWCHGEGCEMVYDNETGGIYPTSSKCEKCNGKGYKLEAIK